MNGLTQVAALAGEASAVALAPISTVGTPKSGPISVGIALLRAVVRNTCTATRVGRPKGSLGNVTSAGMTEGAAPIIELAVAALIATDTAGPVDDRSLKSLKPSAIAPASAPASAAFWACDFAV